MIETFIFFSFIHIDLDKEIKQKHPNIYSEREKTVKEISKKSDRLPLFDRTKPSNRDVEFFNLNRRRRLPRFLAGFWFKILNSFFLRYCMLALLLFIYLMCIFIKWSAVKTSRIVRDRVENLKAFYEQPRARYSEFVKNVLILIIFLVFVLLCDNMKFIVTVVGFYHM